MIQHAMMRDYMMKQNKIIVRDIQGRRASFGFPSGCTLILSTFQPLRHGGSRW